MKYTSERRLSLAEAAQELRTGHILLLQDSLFEPYTVLFQAAQHITREFIEMAMQVQGRLSVALAGERIEALHLSPTLLDNELPFGTQYTTAASGQERGDLNTSSFIDENIRTIHALVDPRTQPEDKDYAEMLVQRAHAGGILKRAGYGEAAIDLMRIAGMELGAVLCPLPLDHGPTRFTRNFGTISVDAIVRYRREHRVSFISQVQLPTYEALFQLHHYQEIETGQPYLALTLGELHHSQLPPPLLRIHSACMTGDIFGSQRCDCQAQLHTALHAIAEEGRGMLLYLPQEGRGIGLSAKLQAYVLQEQGYDTIEANERLGYPADARTFSSAIEILQEMGLRNVRLMTNNPQKIQALEEGGIAVERVALEIPATENNAFYLQTKYERFGHLFT